jgi:RHS repeat-associated protein
MNDEVILEHVELSYDAVGNVIQTTTRQPYHHAPHSQTGELKNSWETAEARVADLAGTNDPHTGDIYSGLDRFGRIKDSYWYNYGSSTDVDRLKYGYDRNGNRTYRENTVATAAGAKFDEKYLYDLIDRLKHLDRGQLTAMKDAITNKTFAQCWQLDATGNWKNFRQDDTGDGTWDLNQNRTDNKVNEITDITETAGPSWVTPAYNRAGNMTTVPKPSDPTQSYTAIYDAWNRLVTMEEGANKLAEYEYDGAKRRTVQTTYTAGVLSEIRHLYYTEPSKWQVIEERTGTSPDSANAERRFVWGLRYIDNLVLRDRDTDGNSSLDERLYAMQDANWNVTGITNASGTVQERYAYTAYGVPIFLDASFGSRGSSSYQWETHFAGYRWDAAIRHFHVRNRIYSPLIGIWLQRDPIGHSVGSNLYEYCLGTPLGRVDPPGLAPVDPNEAARNKCFQDVSNSFMICVASLMASVVITCYNICVTGICITFPPWCFACIMGCWAYYAVGLILCALAQKKGAEDCIKWFPLPKPPPKLACSGVTGGSV